MTAVGPIDVGRRCFTCPACGQGDFGADPVFGLDGSVTPAARRMACLAGIQQSFAPAQTLLAELAGWTLDDETIRRLCHHQAARATATRAARTTAETLAAAGGDREVQIDAGKVNTQEGDAFFEKLVARWKRATDRPADQDDRHARELRSFRLQPKVRSWVGPMILGFLGLCVLVFCLCSALLITKRQLAGPPVWPGKQPNWPPQQSNWPPPQ